MDSGMDARRNFRRGGGGASPKKAPPIKTKKTPYMEQKIARKAPTW